jgi:hypothetical protein
MNREIHVPLREGVGGDSPALLDHLPSKFATEPNPVGLLTRSGGLIPVCEKCHAWCF